jgi:hypothetical protein
MGLARTELFSFLAGWGCAGRAFRRRPGRAPLRLIPIVFFGMVVPMRKVFQVALEIAFVHRAFLPKASTEARPLPERSSVESRDV